MTTWIKSAPLSWWQLLFIKVVKAGRVPRHIAFIMDGNRRYAQRNAVGRRVGHERGFDKLTETLKWCLYLGVQEVTVYAFSIENLNRSEEEVATLMDIAREKFRKMLDEIEQMRAWGVRLCVPGRMSLLPPDLRALMSRAILATRHNDRLVLNVAYVYTGRDEMAAVLSELERAAGAGAVRAEDVSEELVSAACFIPTPDLLVRTSGEVRLSDFMLWQVSDTVLYFTDVLWPQFSLRDLLAAILHYQRRAPPARDPAVSWTDGQRRFLLRLREERVRVLERYASYDVSLDSRLETEHPAVVLGHTSE